MLVLPYAGYDAAGGIAAVLLRIAVEWVTKVSSWDSVKVTNLTELSARNHTLRHCSRPVSERMGAYDDRFLCFGGRHGCQRTLVIQIAVKTLASDSALTIARFRSSKFGGSRGRL